MESPSLFKMLAKEQGLSGDHSIRDMIIKAILVNGGQYCRPHRRLSCHVCEVDYTSSHEAENEKRAHFRCRPCGDANLDEVSHVLHKEVYASQMEFKARQEPYKGKGMWAPGLREWATANENDINARNAIPAECSQCSYYKCGKTTDLKSCAKCKIVKYCSRECQTADWKYEHKYECCP